MISRRLSSTSVSLKGKAMNELEDIKQRAIYMEMVIRRLNERFPGDRADDATIRDLCDAAYDVAHAD